MTAKPIILPLTLDLYFSVEECIISSCFFPSSLMRNKPLNEPPLKFDDSINPCFSIRASEKLRLFVMALLKKKELLVMALT